MFVSSYNTYIDTNSTQRTQSERKESAKKPTSSFESQLLQTTSKEISNKNKLPLNYISDYKALNNRQKLENKELTQNPTKMKFSKINSMSSAHVAYSDNTKMFSLVQKPKQTIDQTPKLDKNLPAPAQNMQEDFLKDKMISAYIANDNYYRITAA